MDWEAITLTLRLAAMTTVILLFISLPLAWWLASSQRKAAVLVEALVAMPLVLPPTVLGFYLLLLMGSQGVLGQMWQQFTGAPLAFTFTGLVIASILYSLPFVVQPLQVAFARLDYHQIDAARTLGAGRYQQWLQIILPQIRRGVLTACVLGFAHTIGEFGVVLMVGGNLSGETRVVSIAIYEYVEALEYGQAHQLSLLLVGFSFVVLTLVYGLNRRWQMAGGRF